MIALSGILAEKRSRIWTAWHVLRHFGLKWAAKRALYHWQLRSGWCERRLPAGQWQDYPISELLPDQQTCTPTELAGRWRSNGERFFIDPTQIPAIRQILLDEFSDSTDNVINEANAICAGRFLYFSHREVVVGMPPTWNRNPIDDTELPVDCHWSRIPDFGGSDIKLIWEANRFAVAYTLVRAFCRTGNDRYVDVFWQLVESWREQNPPLSGPNWKCGQEISLRAMAWCFGLYAFADHPASTPERISQLIQMIGVSASRIEANISYALSQFNNHAICEAAGLFTIGTLFPEFRDAARWKRAGHRHLEDLAASLVYDDGGFSQHSFNYARVMLHALAWSIRLGEMNADPFSDEMIDRVYRAARLMYMLQDPLSGSVPVFGQYDGSLILPLNACNFQDFRPVIQLVFCVTQERRIYPDGPWNEDLVWLARHRLVQKPAEAPTRSDWTASSSGYTLLRNTSGFVFARCGQFAHRPSHADQLHVDVWWKGQNIALDPGTYSYNATSPWNNPLAETRYHNTVTVDGRNQMHRAGRFLWLPWVHGHSSAPIRSNAGNISLWEGYYDGSNGLPKSVRIRRAVVSVGDGAWVVVDRISSRKQHSYRLQWLLMDAPYKWVEVSRRLILETAAGDYSMTVGCSVPRPIATVCRADPESPRGWRSTHYNEREPAVSVDLTCQGSDTTFFTVFSPAPTVVRLTSDQLYIDSSGSSATVQMEPAGIGRIISSVRLTGSVHDTLEVN